MAGPAYFDAFRRITVQPDNVTVTADAVNDQLTLTAGAGISLVANSNNDTITIVNSGSPAPTLDQVLSFGAISNQTATLGGLTVTGELNLPGVVAADLKGSVFADDSTRIINGIDGTVTATTVNAPILKVGGLTIQDKNIYSTVPDPNGTIFITGGTAFGGVRITNNLNVTGVIGRVDAGTNQPLTISIISPTTNTPTDISTPAEWMEIIVNGNTRYIPLYT